MQFKAKPRLCNLHGLFSKLVVHMIPINSLAVVSRYIFCIPAIFNEPFHLEQCGRIFEIKTSKR